MRKLFLTLLGFSALVSCSMKQPDGVVHNCVVTKVTAKDKYSFISDGKYYTIETDCGYTVTDRRSVEVGDTIPVKVIDMNKNSFHK